MPRDLSIPAAHPIDTMTYADEAVSVAALAEMADLTPDDRAKITARAADMVRAIRGNDDPGLMEVFLAEYGLSTDEGIALMCLAEALLRVPDADTIDALIEDKIAPSDWGSHLGHSASPLVNASTWALLLTGRVLHEDTRPGPVAHLRSAVKRLGEPVIRAAVARAMREMGRQFVLGEEIGGAMRRAAKMEAKGYTYSYDMLGEAARTDADARRYHLSYGEAITAIARACTHRDIRRNPGISVKLSALHPRYESMQKARVMADLVPRLRSLALMAKSAGMGLNIDAEEAARLSLSLEVIEATLSGPELAGWDGFGVVVQAYGKRAPAVIDTLYGMAERLDRRIMVRLVKGAYWDTEIKLAQVKGLPGFPVFTTKAATDVSYLGNARKLFRASDRIYPQFATHNAHTVAGVLHMANGSDAAFEFQRLHGMGEALHDQVMRKHGTACRIYAPVGAHRDLLAYLVRRLLENGANSSFVHQIVDESVPAEEVARDPFEAIATLAPAIRPGTDLFQPERPNSKGWDVDHSPTLEALLTRRAAQEPREAEAAPILASGSAPEAARYVTNPADPSQVVGTVQEASAADCAAAIAAAKPWNAPAKERAAILNRAADAFEADAPHLFDLLAREAGKTLMDQIAELREAVDFLRFYAAQASDASPVGTFACIAPWNFPLAIFTGQIAAALAAGNAVLAKPAPQTPLIGAAAVRHLLEAGVPQATLQFLPGGAEVGAALTSTPGVDGVAFTGSTATARHIRRAMSENLTPGAPLIAETGGLNAMIVDSTALPEQAVQAIIESAFQSAGQRCSALRCLYLQKDVAGPVLEMLTGAMDLLNVGDPRDIATDVGPVIDAEARQSILDHIAAARKAGRLRHMLKAPQTGHFVPPALIEVNGIGDLEREVFGPVLHVATFNAQDLDKVIDAINATGYGLTFGLQTRIDDRVQHVADRIHAGNIYVNRNQIGAIVGSQPFGGEGLSGTGPKAGGPLYIKRFERPQSPPHPGEDGWTRDADMAALSRRLAAAPETRVHTARSLPGPTGESNRLHRRSRGPILCAGPGAKVAEAQAEAVRRAGGVPVVAEGQVTADALTAATRLGAVLWWGDEATARAYDAALAQRTGPLVPLVRSLPDAGHVTHERHICVDLTAAGGNAALLGGVG